MHVLGSIGNAGREIGIHGMGDLVEIVPQPLQLRDQDGVGGAWRVCQRDDAGMASAHKLFGEARHGRAVSERQFLQS